MKRFFPIAVILLFSISCDSDIERFNQRDISDIKSVETIFIIHQTDTQEKDDKVVAVVEYNPDGSVKNATQYMTYPYTHMEKAEFSFWTEPNNELLLHLLDGLTLGHAENNFIYGNSWPIEYVEMIDKMGHPQFPKKQDIYSNFTSTAEFEGDLPTIIKTEAGFEENKDWHLGGYEEKFNYNEQKITSYEWRHVISDQMLMAMQEAYEAAEKRNSNRVNSKSKSSEITGSSFQKVSYEYSADKLVKVIEDQREHRFQYDGNRLTRSEFYIKDMLRNHRVYYYFDNGLKEKTVIFNTNNEPEYTIEYQYTFFEQS